MNVDDIVADINFIFICAYSEWENDPTIDKIREPLYETLYKLRKNLTEIIQLVPDDSLKNLAKALKVLHDNSDFIPTEVLEEVQMFLFYEKFLEDLIEKRKLYWDFLEEFY